MTYRASKSGGASAGNVNHTISWSAIGAAVGDDAILCFGWNSSATSLITFTGWTVYLHPAGLSGNQLAILTKTLDATDIANGQQVFTFDSSTRLAWAISLWDSDITLGTAVAVTGTTTGPSLSTLIAGSEAVTVWVNAVASGTVGNDISFTNGTTDADGKTTVASGIQMSTAIGRISAPTPGSYDAGAVINSTTGGTNTNQGVIFEVSSGAAVFPGEILLEDGTPLALEDFSPLLQEA